MFLNTSKNYRTRVEDILKKIIRERNIKNMEKDVYTKNPKFYDDFLSNPNLKTVTACFSQEFKELWDQGYTRYIDGKKSSKITLLNIIFFHLV